MTPQAALFELLARTAAGSGRPVFVTDEDLSQWPAAAIAAMKSQKLLARARPAASVVCTGCEQECVMPVHTLPRAGGSVSSFVVCDKRSDINRVPVCADRLKQWRYDSDALVAFVAGSLGLRRSDQRTAEGGLRAIGMMSASKRTQMLFLRVDGVEWFVVAAQNAGPLADLITFADGGYSIDRAAVCRLVDSATSDSPRYTPSNARREARKLDTREKYSRWQKAYRALKRQHPKMSDWWCARQLSKRDIADGKSADTIRKHMKG